MANVLQSPIDFHPRPVNHAPSPFGFGFGLGTASSAMVTAGWQSTVTPGHTNPLAFQQLASSFNQLSPSRAQKRRHEPEDDAEIDRHVGVRDDAMDRSPTPERPKRSAPKRARMSTLVEAGSKDEKTTKENKAPGGGGDDNEVDVGVLLASLPPQSLLPLLTSLLITQPSLKSTILPLIPRPTLETAIQALASSAKKLRDAYPYSNVPPFSQLGSSTTSFGFGSGFSSTQSTTFVSSSSRPSLSQNQSIFGQPNPNPHHNHGGMRESYILSRLRPHITEFVAACMSYLPYFSYIPTSATSRPPQSNTTSHQLSQSPSLQSLHKDKSHPSETYVFLSALTNHLVSQPPLTQSSLAPLLLPRLSEEWKAWVDRVDEVVNRQGGMFGSETVRGWERGLDELAETKGPDGGQFMRDVRDRWVAKVGWLVGRMVQQPMEEH